MNRGKNMNKILVSLAASLAVLGVVFAQVPGGVQEAPRPGQTPFPLGQGGGMRAGGGASVAASGNYVYVVSGNTLYQFSVDGLKLVAKTTLPTASRGEGGGNGGGGRGQGRPDGIQK
jgi:hypothetical protein